MLANYTIDGFENIQYQGFGRLKFIENKLSGLYADFGYCQVNTPTFETYDFYANEDSINSDDLFKLVSSTGKVLALKPDATLPIARMAAINHHDPEEIVKFSYLTNIYRDFSAPEIQKKETTQTGIEYFGNSAPECDGEVIALAIMSLRLAGVEDIHIDLGHVGFINEMLRELNLEPEQQNRLFRYIENKNLGDIQEFLKKTDIPENYKKIIRTLPRLYGEPERIFRKMRELSVNPEMLEAVDNLTAVYSHLEDLGLAHYVQFDLGFTNNMNYYSGMIFKGYIESYGEPVISGGRYDTMSARFGIDRPACGFGIDLLRLMDYLQKNNIIPEQDHSKSVLIYDPAEKTEAYRFCKEKRKTGSAEMFALRNDEPEAWVRKILKNPHYGNADIFLLRNGLFLWQPDTGFTAVTEQAAAADNKTVSEKAEGEQA
ncbi:MAG: ATP phosphoribosyltransferase regulatory subunit [Eubacteriaceae bacterium]|jgi:ATP phosphoribosyltransferase regulatory subunit